MAETNLSNGTAKLAFRDLWKIIVVVVGLCITIGSFIFSLYASDRNIEARINEIMYKKVDNETVQILKEAVVEIRGDIKSILEKLNEKEKKEKGRGQ
jgi:hypothetical protein